MNRIVTQIFCAMLLTAGSLAFAQGQDLSVLKNTPAQPKAGTPQPIPGAPPDQACQQKCAQQMSGCIMPCMPKSTDDANKPGAKNSIANCSKKCAEQQKPCFDACKKDSKKKGGETEAAGDGHAH